jgi:membrane protease YdiL (CAAX protease family)
LLYPLWGIVQQAIFQGILHRRLARLFRSPAFAVSITALLFALVHLGNARLVPLALGAGLLWSLFFRRWPNLWALGLSHGILAVLAYTFLLQDRPLTRVCATVVFTVA